jgi:hypothetical protein
MHETVKPLDDVLLKHQGTSCRVELWGHPEQALVIATEIPENTGKSITSVVTELAAEVVRAFRLDWLGMTWISHHPTRSVVHPETFYKVDMKWTGSGFIEPLAREISLFEVEKLFQSRGQILMP